MKIIAIGRNYAEHAKELKNDIPSEPVIFLKPDTAVLRPGYDFYMPDFSADIHHEIELVLKITKAGKNIEERFAHKYYDEIGIGIDFTARDLQSKQKAKGLPWEIAKGFDGSAPLGQFYPKSSFQNLHNMSFHLAINGATVQQGNTKDLLFNFDVIIAYISKFFTLKKGDLIFTGTPQGVGPIKAGDKLEGYIEGQKALALNIK